MALSLDRKAFIDILSEGQGDIGGAMQPPPEGLWGMPPELLQTLPGYGPDVQKNRAEAREIMQKLGYGPDKRLAVKVSARNIPAYRDPAVIADRPAEGDLYRWRARTVETANWYPKVMRKDYTVGAQWHRQRRRRPRPAILRELRLRLRPQLHRLLQSRDRQADRPAIDGGRPGKAQEAGLGDRAQAGRRTGRGRSSSTTAAATCWQPHVKGLTMMVNSIYNGWRMEDVWLDKVDRPGRRRPR